MKRLLAACCLTAAACASPGEPAPVALTVTAAPVQVLAGGAVTIASPQLRGAADGDVRVTLADSGHLFIAVRRLDDSTVAFDVPPLLTGTYAFRADLDGDAVTPAAFTLQVRGLASLRYLPRAAGWRHAALVVGGGALYMGVEPFQNGLERFRFVSPISGSSRTFPQDTAMARAMYAPGPSFRAGHAVLDFSAALFAGNGPGDAAAWDLGAAGTPVRARSLPCSRGLYHSYTAAELSDVTCLLLVDDSLLRDGSALITTEPGFWQGEFRLSPDAQRAVVVMRDVHATSSLAGTWPVLDNGGQVAWSSGRYTLVTGAAFSPDSDTLFVVGRLAAGGGWVLDALDAGTGARFASVPFPGLELRDVLVDPVRSRLYVEGTTPDPQVPSFRDRSVLVALDRASLTQVAVIPAPDFWWPPQAGGSGGTLVFGGASGRIHLLASDGFESVWDFAYDTP